MRNTERTIVHAADKIASMKEDFDAMSWARIDEIADELRKDGLTDTQRIECAREMTAIAEANKVLMARLGFEEETVRPLMGSGVEIPDELYATPKIAPTMMSNHDDTPLGAGGIERRDELEGVEPQGVEMAGPAPHQMDGLPDWAIDNAHTSEIADFFDGSTDERDRSVAGVAIPRGARLQTGAADTVFGSIVFGDEHAEQDRSTKSDPAAKIDIELGRMPQVVGVSQAACAADETHSTDVDGFADAGVPDSVAAALEKLSEKRNLMENEKPKAKHAAIPEVDTGERFGLPSDLPRAGKKMGNRAGEHERKMHSKHEFSRFSCLYESNDGALALYEDADGHITAVDTSKLI